MGETDELILRSHLIMSPNTVATKNSRVLAHHASSFKAYND